MYPEISMTFEGMKTFLETATATVQDIKNKCELVRKYSSFTSWYFGNERDEREKFNFVTVNFLYKLVRYYFYQLYFLHFQAPSLNVC